MNQVQENKNSSYKALRALFAGNGDAINNLPVMPQLVADFGQNCTEIDNSASRQGIDKSGLSDTKEILREALTAATLNVSKRIVAYATVMENVTLLKEAKVSDSELRRLADTKLRPRAQGVYNLSVTHAVAIQPYGVSEAVRNNLGAALQAYETTIPQPRLGIEEQKLATGNLARLFLQNDALLKKTDALMELVQTDDPDFYDSYRSLRRVETAGKGFLTLKILVTDAATGTGIPKVKLLLEAVAEADAANAGTKISSKLTSALGGINIKSLPQGKYTINASKPGFISQTVQAIVITGELCNVTIELIAG